MSEAKEEAVRAIIEFVKAPDMFQLGNKDAKEKLRELLLSHCPSFAAKEPERRSFSRARFRRFTVTTPPPQLRMTVKWRRLNSWIIRTPAI
ncbi:hypothetical protein H6P81_017628 [Aristolochia fimbriata]|uniref:Uncharacterized protein n=1 Tax=Aristolochia fimbriata TaxID=158543 RepID=A0AAV7E0F9_ARIFI|nr:hypothetical protein H6P81_017628 [Aristolochia fimbriata]